jgi:hypothetical protein
MFAINAYPIKARPRNEPGQVRPRKHLPCSERNPRTRRKSLLQPICRFHYRSHGVSPERVQHRRGDVYRLSRRSGQLVQPKLYVQLFECMTTLWNWRNACGGSTEIGLTCTSWNLRHARSSTSIEKIRVIFLMINSALIRSGISLLAFVEQFSTCSHGLKQR